MSTAKTAAKGMGVSTLKRDEVGVKQTISEGPNNYEMVALGATDRQGREVTAIISDTSEYKVYATPDGTFFAPDENLTSAPGMKKQFLEISDDIAAFEHQLFVYAPDYYGSDSKQRRMRKFRGARAYERELGNCIGKAMSDDIPGAKASLRRLRDRMSAQRGHKTRVMHLGINLVLALLIWVVAIGVVVLDIQTTFGFNVKQICVAAFMGSFGALFSTAVRLYSMKVDPLVSGLVQIIYASQRILVGVLAAIILLFGFQSGILQNVLQPPGAGGDGTLALEADKVVNLYWLGFVSVLAGFSERLVPNLLSSQTERIEERQTEEHQKERDLLKVELLTLETERAKLEKALVAIKATEE